MLSFVGMEGQASPDFQHSLIKREVSNVYFILQQHNLAEMRFFSCFLFTEKYFSDSNISFFFISHPVIKSNFSFEHSMLVWL